MATLKVALGDRSYDIVIGRGMLGGIGSVVRKLGARSGKVSPRMAVISNPTVYGLYGDKVTESLRYEGFDAVAVIVPDGEEHKTQYWVDHMHTEMLKHRLDRSSLLVALGGGVIGDMAGYAASTYMRGIGFVQVPTTLLAQVDSSVGGKTGVNHALGKNMIGTFWQPSLVWMDLAALRTLPRRELLAGMAEVIKYGIIRDEEFFRVLEVRRREMLDDPTGDAIEEAVRRSCEIKAEVVGADEREGGLRAILNYGHTVGHAVETLTEYTRFLHGEAVAIGMCAEARLAAMLGHLKQQELDRIVKLVADYGLPTDVPEGLDPEAMVNAMGLDKKTEAGTIRFILPTRIGDVLVNKPVGEAEIIASLSGR